MSFDFASKYADKVANADFDRVDREYIEEGPHLIRIDRTECLTSQNTDRDMVVLEGEIVASSTMQAGELIKHIWTLNGVDKWKIARNLGQLKSVVLATLPPEVTEITGDVVSKAIDGGDSAIVCGAIIRVEAKNKISKNDASFTSYSFLRAPSDLESFREKLQAPQSNATTSSEWGNEESVNAWNAGTSGD